MTHISDRLRAACDPATPLFLLVDPFLGEPFPLGGWYTDEDQLNAQRQAIWDRQVSTVRLPSRIDLELSWHPYLVQLQGRNDPLIDSSCEMAESERIASQAAGLAGPGASAHRIGGWLQSSLLPEQLAKQLATMMQLRCMVPTSTSYLRLADRRVFALARHVIGDTRVAGNLGRIQFWAYLDAQGNLDMVHSTNEQAQHSSLIFSLPEWITMEQGIHVHPCMAMWLGQLNLASLETQTLHLQSARSLFTPALQAVQKAEQAARHWPERLQSPKDFPFWAALVLLHPELCDQDQLPITLREWLSPDPNGDQPVEPLHEQVHELLHMLQAKSTAPDNATVSPITGHSL